MVAAAFDYITVGSYHEAAQLLATVGDDAKILDGGQS
jgi:CO/xanthine dehydrogenase FAD-binding subunit